MVTVGFIFVDLVTDFESHIKDTRVCDSIAAESAYIKWLPIHQNQKKHKYCDFILYNEETLYKNLRPQVLHTYHCIRFVLTNPEKGAIAGDAFNELLNLDLAEI